MHSLQIFQERVVVRDPVTPVLADAARRLVFGEVPFVLRYDRKGGESKMNVWRTARQTLRLLVERRLGHE